MSEEVKPQEPQTHTDAQAPTREELNKAVAEAIMNNAAAKPPMTPQQMVGQRMQNFLVAMFAHAEAQQLDVAEMILAVKSMLAVKFAEHDGSLYRAWSQSLEKEIKHRRHNQHVNGLRDAQIKRAERENSPYVADSWSNAVHPDTPSINMDDAPEKGFPGGTLTEYPPQAPKAKTISQIPVENTDAARDYLSGRDKKAVH